MGFGTEILFILFLGLLILGPRRLHTLLGHAARAKARFEEASQGLKSQLAAELDFSWLKETRTYHVQGWLNSIGEKGLSRNTLKHIKSVISAIFTLAKQQDYFQGENPSRDTSVNPAAAEPQDTYAYTLEDVQGMLAVLPEPAGTAFAIAAYMGPRTPPQLRLALRLVLQPAQLIHPFFGSFAGQPQPRLLAELNPAQPCFFTSDIVTGDRTTPCRLVSWTWKFIRFCLRNDISEAAR